jgi:hypothetical protein
MQENKGYGHIAVNELTTNGYSVDYGPRCDYQSTNMMRERYVDRNNNSFSVDDAHETRYVRNMAESDRSPGIDNHVRIRALAMCRICQVEHLIVQIDISRLIRLRGCV